MKPRDHFAAIALSASLVVHGATLYLLSEGAIRDLDRSRYQPPLPRLAAVSESRILIDEPTPPRPTEPAETPKKPQPPKPQETRAPKPKPTDPTPLAAPKPPAPPPAELLPQPIRPPELAPSEPTPPPLVSDGFGELAGDPDATAMHSLSGDRPMQAPKSEQDQPFISRDPMGQGSPQDLPSEADAGKVDQKGEKGDAGTEGHTTQLDAKPAETPTPVSPTEAPAPAKPQPIAQPEPTPEAPKLQPLPQYAIATPRPNETNSLTGPNIQADSPAAIPQPLPQVLPAKPSSPPTPDPLPPTPSPVTPSPTPQPAAPTAGGKFGSSKAASSTKAKPDAAPMTDSESDPFSIVGSAEFRQGSVKARFGRKVTTVRPRLSLAGRQDLLIVEHPRVVLRVRVDETGTVRDVKVVASSGSDEIDQPCVLAMYEWWFEPLRDKSGKPMPAEMIWTLSWRIR